MIGKILSFFDRWAMLIIALVAIAAIAAATVLSYKLRDAKRDTSLAERNAAAVADTLRRYEADQRVVVSRMQTQAEIDRGAIEALSEALGAAIRDRDQKIVALSQLRVAFDALRDSATSTVVITDPVTQDREGSFAIIGPPIDGGVDVYVPADLEAPWRAAWDLTVTPFNMVYTIGCDELNSALVNVEAPDWVPLTLDRGTIDPNVCHPRSTPLFQITKSKTAFGVAGFLLGLAIAHWTDDGFTKAIIPGG